LVALLGCSSDKFDDTGKKLGRAEGKDASGGWRAGCGDKEGNEAVEGGDG
jgi:hypothetical protein